MPSMKLGKIRCDAGQKASGYIPVTNRVDGTPFGFPVVVVCGKKDGPVLLLNGAIHGDEHEGTQAIAELTREIEANDLRGTLIGVPVMNVGAFAAMLRGNPRDTHSPGGVMHCVGDSGRKRRCQVVDRIRNTFG